MDDSGYDFVIMVKGMKKLVSEVVLENRGTFEDNRKNSIRAYKVSGTTVKRKLYADDRRNGTSIFITATEKSTPNGRSLRERSTGWGKH